MKYRRFRAKGQWESEDKERPFVKIVNCEPEWKAGEGARSGQSQGVGMLSGGREM